MLQLFINNSLSCSYFRDNMGSDNNEFGDSVSGSSDSEMSSCEENSSTTPTDGPSKHHKVITKSSVRVSNSSTEVLDVL